MKKMMVLVMVMATMVLGSGCGVQEKVRVELNKAMIKESGIVQQMVNDLNECCEHDGWTAFEKTNGEFELRHTGESDWCTYYIENEDPTFVEDMNLMLNGEIVKVY